MARSRKPPEKASTAAQGAPFLLAHAVKVFDKGNGDAVEWPELAGAALAVMVHALDKAGDDPRAMMLLRSLETAVYERLAGPVVTAGPGHPPSMPAASIPTAGARALPAPHPRGIGRG